MSYGFSKFRKTESPVFSAWQVDRYDRELYCVDEGRPQFGTISVEIHLAALEFRVA